MYLGEAIAKGGVNALLYRKSSDFPAARLSQGVTIPFADAIADDWGIAPERFTLEEAIEEARKLGSCNGIRLRHLNGHNIGSALEIGMSALDSDEWELY